MRKTLMYEFYYDSIKNRCGNKAKLLVADTDSLIYEIKNHNVYEYFYHGKEMFDFRNYPEKKVL